MKKAGQRGVRRWRDKGKKCRDFVRNSPERGVIFYIYLRVPLVDIY